MLNLRRAGAVVAALTLALAAATPASAANPDAGLYGSGDPTYDGVFRQSLALAGLSAVDVKAAPDAIVWLLEQQCADGGFQAYRADTSVACTPSDPVNYAGEDTNSTATALIALMALNNEGLAPTATLSKESKAAQRAFAWLRKQQGSDGGWAYYPGSASDANSTGLVLSALQAVYAAEVAPTPVKRGKRFLATLTSPCSARPTGAMAYQPGGPANASASAQGYLGLAGSIPVRGPRSLSRLAPCGSSAASKVSTYLAAQLASNGTLPSSMGSGADNTSTAFAVLAFAAAGTGKAAVAKATNALSANARSYATTSPAALGLLLMVADATGRSPKSFGGMNLVSALQATKR